MSSFLERYHELTKYDPRTIDRLGQANWAEQPRAWKAITGTEHVDIRPHLEFLSEFVRGDGSAGAYPSPSNVLDLASLSRISWFASGVSAMGGSPQDPHLYRTNPSAGGLYPIELYWIVLDVEGLEPGIWQFHAPGFALVPVWKGNFRAEALAALLGSPPAREASAIAVLTGIFSRGSWRYGERAYRRILLDAGHLAGNLLEAVRRESFEAVPLSGFCDACLSEFLFPDQDEVPLLAVPVGKCLTKNVSRSLRSPMPDPTEFSTHVASGKLQERAHHLSRIPAGTPTPASPFPESTRKADLEYVPLPPPLDPGNITRAAIDRRSCRSYGWAPVTLQQLSTLLHWSDIPPDERLSPTGLLDTWLVVNAVEGLDSGVWHWDHRTGSIAPNRMGRFREDCLKMCLGQELGGNASFVVVHTAPLAKAVEILGERAYRPLCMDAGQFGERLNLSAQAMGLGASGIGGYFDDLVNETIGQDLSHAILYVTTVGEPG
jgi:SagB-type dehydrogenase family enzyme